MSGDGAKYSAVAKALLDAENERPSRADYARIGEIALQHTGLEYQFESLVWLYMGDTDLGHIATANRGSVEITNMLETLVEWTEPSDEAAEAIDWAIECFHTLRVKRNSVIHGFNFKADQKQSKLYIERRTKSIVFDNNEVFELTPVALALIVAEQRNLATYVYLIGRWLEMRGPDGIGPAAKVAPSPFELPPKPPAPDKLIPLDREVVLSARRQREASRASDAKERKIALKESQRAQPQNKKKG